MSGSHTRICKDILGGVPSLAASSPAYMSGRNATLLALYFPSTGDFGSSAINFSAPGVANITQLLEVVGRTPVCNMNLYVCVCEWGQRGGRGGQGEGG